MSGRNYNKNFKIAILIIVISISILCMTIGILGIYDKITIDNQWSSLTMIYLGIAIITFMPTLKSMILNDNHKLYYTGVELEETQFSEENKQRLKKYNSMMDGTLRFWKRNAKIYKSVHYYCVIWTTLLAVLMPILIQALPEEGKMILTIISAHSGILIAFNKGLKIESNYKSYRLCESNFYDEYRKLLYSDIDKDNIENQTVIINNYIEKVNALRKIGRLIEIDNMPSIQENYQKEKNNE